MEMGKKKAPEGFLPEPFLPASPFLKGTYSRTFNFITLVLIFTACSPSRGSWSIRTESCKS